MQGTLLFPGIARDAFQEAEAAEHRHTQHGRDQQQQQRGNQRHTLLVFS